jgi:DNA primase
VRAPITSQLRDAIKAFDIEKFLSEHASLKPAGDERIMDCPVCGEDGHSDKLWFNVKKKTGWCYVCEESWSLVKVVGHFLNLDLRKPSQYIKICQFLYDATGVTNTSTLRRTLEASQAALAPEEVEVETPRYVAPPALDLPAEFVTLPKKLPAYFATRNITKEQVKRHGIGWCERGYFKNRMIIPVVMNKKVVSYIARYMGKPPEGVKKYLYPKGNPTGKTFFNFDNAKKFKTVVLTEGYLDAVAVGLDAMGLGGKSLSDQQALLLASLDLDEVIVMLDGDSAGREGATKVARKLSSFVPSVRIASLPDGKDPDELTEEELAAIREDALPLNSTVPKIKIDLEDF